MQHQIWVSGLSGISYFSFDGFDGIDIEVQRNEQYIQKMIEKEYEFYLNLKNKTPPERSEDDYIERNDELWERHVLAWKSLKEQITKLEKQEEEARRELIFLSGESNTRGSGISLCQIQRKGNVDYSQIPQLKGIDLEVYRKPSSSSWRISC